MKKKLLAAILAAVMLLTACGFIVVDDAEEKSLSSVILPEARGENATEYSNSEIQTRLIELGFLTGRADGILGPRSKAAIEAFQGWCGLPVTGEADEKTTAMLFGDPSALPTPSPTPLASGAKDSENSDDVLKLQTRLSELNYFSAKADGIFGGRTEAALIEFQEANGLEGTGVADEKTLDIMNSLSVVPKPTPEPTPRAKGAAGSDVRNIQEALRIMGFMGGDVDGDFGEETDVSVKRYQQYIHDAEEAYALANPTPEPTPETTITPRTTAPAATSRPVITIIGSNEPEVTDEPIDTPTTEPTEEPTPTPTPTYVPDGIVTDELMADIIAMKGVTLYVEDMQKGSKGDEVVRLQRRLASLWYLSPYGGVDGQYGAKTEAALKYFQKRNGLEETGIADKAVQTLLFSANAEKSDRPILMYKLKISVDKQRVYAYEWVNGDYELVRTMVCSTGTTSNPTPLGTYSAGGPCGRWYYFKKFECWAQYGYQIVGGILFHSVIYSSNDESTLRQSSVNALGSRASHGCIRLKVADAKWIYNNCPKGTSVTIY